MNMFRRLVTSFVIVSTGLVSQSVLAEGVVAFPDGAIKFAASPDGSGASCGIDLKSGAYLFAKGTTCKTTG